MQAIVLLILGCKSLVVLVVLALSQVEDLLLLKNL